MIDCTKPSDLLAGWPGADIVHRSPTASALLAELDSAWVVVGADLDNKGWAIDPDEKIILVDSAGLSATAILRSNYFQNTLLLRTFSALRAAWQAERADDARRMHRPDLWPLLGRILAADVGVMAIRMIFETRRPGEDSLWRHVLGDENGDMAAGYARALERRICAKNDAEALTEAFVQWFDRDSRVTRTDHATLADMDDALAVLLMEGRGQISEGALRCLTIDPASGTSYLGRMAGEIAGNPAWRSISDPVAEAHFLQIMDEIGATRVGNVSMRDKKLAARLFPEALVRV